MASSINDTGAGGSWYRDEHPTARSVRDLEPPDVRDRLDAIDEERAQEAVRREAEPARARTLERIQETADEPNAREAAERDSAALVPVEITDKMVDAYVRAIFSGWYIEMKGEELRQDVRAGLAAVVPLIRTQVAAEQSGWPFAEALRRLDRVGGVSPAEEEPTDAQAAFEAGGKGETGQPTALVTVDLADLLTALNQRTRHSHMRPGVWDASNPPWRANLPCVECEARERLRAALATATSSEEQDRG